jgi:apolipoprotein N-acyltransferase
MALFVILGTFLTSALLAFFMALPAVQWAEGGQDWQGVLAVLWLVACVAVNGYLAVKVLGRYHRATSEGRRKKV